MASVVEGVIRVRWEGKRYYAMIDIYRMSPLGAGDRNVGKCYDSLNAVLNLPN